METENQLARKGTSEHHVIDHLSTNHELGIEEIVRKEDQCLPVGSGRPATKNIPLTGVSVSPLDGVVVVGEMDVPGAGEHGKKATNRFQREGL